MDVSTTFLHKVALWDWNLYKMVIEKGDQGRLSGQKHYQALEYEITDPEAELQEQH